jgi:hypothetical protein
MATFLEVRAPDYGGIISINFDNVVMLRKREGDDEYCTIHYDTKMLDKSDFIVLRESYYDILWRMAEIEPT